MAAITGEGSSTSWLQQKANVKRIFSQFQAQDPELSVDWDLLSALLVAAFPGEVVQTRRAAGVSLHCGALRVERNEGGSPRDGGGKDARAAVGAYLVVLDKGYGSSGKGQWRCLDALLQSVRDHAHLDYDFVTVFN